MDAIKLLEKQHHEVEELFAKAEKTKSATMRRRLFEKIGDALAVHATIEEKILYPNVFGKTTKDILLEAVEEHLAAKRVIADLIALDPTDEHYAAKLSVLKEEITHHIREERKELFPKAKKLVSKEVMAALGVEMEAMATQLAGEAEAPRMRVPNETQEAAPLH